MSDRQLSDRQLIDITSLAHDGRGVSRVGGKVAFVAGALAGETVEADCVNRHKRFDEYRVHRVLTPSAERVNPRCPLVGTCGGCDLQHLEERAQVLHKQQVVLELLSRQAGLTPETVEEAILSDSYHYRRRARLAVQIPRRGGSPVVGFRQASSDAVVAVGVCPILVAPLARLPGKLQDLIGGLERPAAIGHIELALSEAADGRETPLVFLHGVESFGTADLGRLAEFAQSEAILLALREGAGEIRIVHDPVGEGAGYLLPEFDLRLGYEPGDFLQGNASVNRQLVGRLVAWLDSTPRGLLLDAFCGLGNFSLPLARRGSQVLGIDVASPLIRRASVNAVRNSIDQTRFLVGDLMEMSRPLPREALIGAVLDPPRQGAQKLIEVLAVRRVSPIVYVSCQPSTLARDAGVLAESGYRLERLAVADMFPQTSHIETLALFVAAPGRGKRKG